MWCHPKNSNQLKRKNSETYEPRGQKPLSACGTNNEWKGTILEGWGGHTDTASIFIEDEDTSSGLRVCTLSADHPRASSLPAKDRCTGEEAIMLCGNTKKRCNILRWKY